jgi:hypothetical protein
MTTATHRGASHTPQQIAWWEVGRELRRAKGEGLVLVSLAAGLILSMWTGHWWWNAIGCGSALVLRLGGQLERIEENRSPVGAPNALTARPYRAAAPGRRASLLHHRIGVGDPLVDSAIASTGGSRTLRLTPQVIPKRSTDEDNKHDCRHLRP